MSILIWNTQASDAPAVYKVVTSQTHAVTAVLPAGLIYRINTGNPLPAGTDTVIMVEDTRLISTMKDSDGIKDGEEDEVETLAQVPVGENVRAPGSDVRQGDLVLQKGERIRSSGGEIGTLAFVGRKEVYSSALLFFDYRGISIKSTCTGRGLQEARSRDAEHW
jgi:gephyrin